MNTTKQLFDFQKESESFLLARSHAILADAPGVGKTPPVCTAIAKLGATSLIICPPSIKDTWKYRLNEWGAGDDVQVLWSGKDKVRDARHTIVNRDLLYAQHVREQLLARLYGVVAVDEAHEFKSLRGSGSDIMFCGDHPLIGRGRYRWLISGSMMPNRPLELYPALAAMFPEVIKGYESFPKFTTQFCGGYFDGEGWNATGSSNISILRTRLSPYMLRRELTEVYDNIPDVLEKDIYIDVDMAESERDTVLATLEKLVGIAKLPGICRYIKDWMQANPGKKLVVFTHHREVTEKIYEHFREFSVRYYGGMGASEKSSSLSIFRNEDSCSLFIVNMRSGGVGLDGLQYVCNHALYAQINWDEPSQSAGRLVRTGQTEPVYLTRLIAAGTIEETCIFSQRQKKTIQDILYAKTSETETLEKENKEFSSPITTLTKQLYDNNSKEKETMTAEANLERIAKGIERLNELIESGKVQIGGTTPDPKPPTARTRQASTTNGATAKPAEESVAPPAKSEPAMAESSPPPTPATNEAPKQVDHDRCKKAAGKILNESAKADGIVGTGDDVDKARAAHPLTIANKAQINEVVAKHGSASGFIKDLPPESWADCATALEALKAITTVSEPELAGV